jgi:integrase/recombinase XerD
VVSDNLRYFLSWCERYNHKLEDLTQARIRPYLQFLRSEYKQANGKKLSDYTIHGYAQVVKGFLSWCSQEEGLDQYVGEKSVARIELPRVEKKIIDTFTPAEIERIFLACTKESTAQLVVRNRAIVAVLLDTGTRVSELFLDPARIEREHTGLLRENVYPSEKDGYIKITGKGRKEREIALGSKSRLALYRYVTRPWSL